MRLSYAKKVGGASFTSPLEANQSEAQGYQEQSHHPIVSQAQSGTVCLHLEALGSEAVAKGTLRNNKLTAENFLTQNERTLAYSNDGTEIIRGSLSHKLHQGQHARGDRSIQDGNDDGHNYHRPLVSRAGLDSHNNDDLVLDLIDCSTFVLFNYVNNTILNTRVISGD